MLEPALKKPGLENFNVSDVIAFASRHTHKNTTYLAVLGEDKKSRGMG